MRKKIFAFVFAAGLTLAVAVPLVGGGGSVHAQAHQCNTTEADPKAPGGVEDATCDEGTDGDGAPSNFDLQAADAQGAAFADGGAGD